VAKREACFPVAPLLAAICVSCFAGDLAEPTDASRTEKVKKEQCGWGMSLRCSHDCLRGVDYLLYLFGRAFIALTRSLPLLLGFAFRSLSLDHEST